jgi:hypothetical protein
MPDGRRIALLAAAIGLAVLLFLLLLPRSTPEQVAEVDAAAPVAGASPTARAGELSTTPVAHLPSPVSSASPTAVASPDTTPLETPADDALAQTPQVVALGRLAADQYRDLAQYPPWSRPFSEEGEDPILRDRQVSAVTAAGPEGEEPILTVFPDQVSFEAPDPVTLYAFLSIGNDRVAAAEITGVITSENLEPLAALAYRDDGDGGDRVAADFIYTARFEPDEGFAPELSESFLVRVRALTTDQQERIAATGFLYSSPHAQLTGRYRDAIADGSLAIDAEVEVFRPGRFHLEATLYDRDGRRGIAEAHAATELGPGRQWMRLTFFGRILNQSGIDGPYLLRFVALSTTTHMPNAKNRLIEDAHLTGPYRAAQFNPAPFDDPNLLDAADRLDGTLEGEQ